MKHNHTRAMITLGLLTAMEIVLSRFCSISAWNVKIGFSFVPVAFAALRLGPLQGGLVGALGDFLGAVLFPIGAYFPGFTLTAFLTGLVFGLFLKEKPSPWRILGAVLVNQLIFSLLVNSLWISILYSTPFVPLVLTRSLQCLVLAPAHFILISCMIPALSRFERRNAA